MSDGFSIGIGLLVKFLKPLWTGLTFLRDALSKRYLLPLDLNGRTDSTSEGCILAVNWEPLTRYLEYSIEVTRDLIT